MGKRWYLLALMFFFMLSFTLAESEVTVYQNATTANYTVVCLNDAYCSDVSFCNINIVNPDKTLLVNGQNMTNQGSTHNYTITPIQVGEYHVGGYCQDGSDYAVIDDSFWVTTTGEILSTGEAILYIFLLIGSVCLFIFMFYWMMEIEFGDFFDYETGQITGKNDWKYLKIFLMPVNYVMLAWIFGLSRSIAANYLALPGLALIFNWAFWIMMYLAVPLLILTLWLLFISIINDKKITEALERGSPLNGP